MSPFAFFRGVGIVLALSLPIWGAIVWLVF